MARNGSGTWSAPAGQPAVAGTAISPTAHNDLVTDLGTELTDSLSRSGKGAMLAPLKATDGAVGSPSVTFASEPTSGLYRAGDGDARFGILGALVQKWLATGIEITGSIKSSLGLADDTTHGNRGGGALHADVAAGGASGFMTGADKAKLDGANTTATAGTDWSLSAINSVRRAAGVVSFSFAAQIGAITTGGWTSIATLPAGSRPASNIRAAGYINDQSTGTDYPAVFLVNASGVLSLEKYDNGTALVAGFTIAAGDGAIVSGCFVI